MFKMDENDFAPEDALDVLDIQKFHAGNSVSVPIDVEGYAPTVLGLASDPAPGGTLDVREAHNEKKSPG